jgi:hypothetical protein
MAIPKGLKSLLKNHQAKLKKNSYYGPRVVELPNPKIQSEDEKFITHEKCKIKSGYLKIVRNPSVLPQELQLYKIFVSLNLNSVNLYLDTSGARTLFNSIKLNRIIRLAQQKPLIKHNCFDFLVHDVLQHNQSLDKGQITLCARNQFEMRSWVNAIGEFKECLIDKNNDVKDNKILVDYNKVNELLRLKASRYGEGEKSLYYDNTNKAIRKSPSTIKKENDVGKAMGTILDTIKKGSFMRSKLHREMKGKLDEAKRYAKEMLDRQEIIRKILRKRQDREKEKEKDLLKQEGKSKQMQLLKAVQKKIKNMENDDLNKLKGDMDKDVKDQQKKANDVANDMMRNILAQNRLKPYDVCISPKLLNFEDGPYVEGICRQYYGEHVSKNKIEILILYLSLKIQNYPPILKPNKN